MNEETQEENINDMLCVPRVLCAGRIHPPPSNNQPFPNAGEIRLDSQFTNICLISSTCILLFHVLFL